MCNNHASIVLVLFQVQIGIMSLCKKQSTNRQWEKIRQYLYTYFQKKTQKIIQSNSVFEKDNDYWHANLSITFIPQKC
jgi:hypothetical protein